MLSIVMLSFVYAEHINKAQHADCCYDESHYAECDYARSYYAALMLSVVMLSAVHVFQ